MTAIYYEGDEHLRVGKCQPVAPGVGEVQISVSYAGICGTDLHIFHGHMDKRVTFPHVIGHEMSGIVQHVGEGVTTLVIGDHVTVMPLASCGQCPACRAGHSHICQNLKFLGIETPGACQSSWTVPASTVHKIPVSLPLTYGALIEPLAVACHDVRIGEVQTDDYTVVLGGGPIGTLIALVARAAGAHVVVSEINPYRIALLQALGFATVNPKEQDLVAVVLQETSGAGADVVFEVTSTQAGATTMTQLSRTRGRIVIVGIFNQPASIDLHQFFWRELRLRGARVYEHEDFEKAIRLATEDTLPLEQLITETLPLEALERGFRQMESGGNVMKILLSCS